MLIENIKQTKVTLGQCFPTFLEFYIRFTLNVKQQTESF